MGPLKRLCKATSGRWPCRSVEKGIEGYKALQSVTQGYVGACEGLYQAAWELEGKKSGPQVLHLTSTLNLHLSALVPVGNL